MIDKDWESTVKKLTEQQNWENMWQLAQTAPVGWSVKLLMRLKEAHWTPEEETEQKAFKALSKLAEACQHVETRPLSPPLQCHIPLSQHGSAFEFFAMNSSGRLMASKDRDKMIRVWDLLDGGIVCTLEGDSWFYINDLALSADGQHVIGGDNRGFIRLWRLPDGKLSRSIKLLWLDSINQIV